MLKYIGSRIDEWKVDVKYYSNIFFGTKVIKDKNTLIDFWLHPNHSNQPEYYKQNSSRSDMLVDLAHQYAKPAYSFLEIGCNVGRNLSYLHNAGYTNVSGIELNPVAIEEMKKTFPYIVKKSNILQGAVEDVLPGIKENAYDVVFTMAVLEHIHPESDWIFSDMSRISRRLIITIENERHIHWRSEPRDYARIFLSLGWKEEYVYRCTDVHELGPSYFARVFSKRT